MPYWVCSICGYQAIDCKEEPNKCPLCQKTCSFINATESATEGKGGDRPDWSMINRITMEAHQHGRV
jgi:hypothetical protein